MSIIYRKGLAFLVASQLFCLGLLSPVYADDETQAETMEELVVTGSRIPRSGFDTLYSVNVVDSEFIEQRALALLETAPRAIKILTVSDKAS